MGDHSTLSNAYRLRPGSALSGPSPTSPRKLTRGSPKFGGSITLEPEQDEPEVDFTALDIFDLAPRSVLFTPFVHSKDFKTTNVIDIE